MYSTCVSECFVPEMNVTAERIAHSPWRATTSSAPSPLRTVITAARGQCPASDAAALLEPVRLRRHDHQVGSRQVRGRARSDDASSEIGPPRDAKARAVQSERVFLAPAEHRDVRDTPEVAGEEGADHARAHDADALDHAAASFPWR